MILKTRFAPSPTGLIHIGNCRTALFNFFFAQRHQGHFLLRIEDTDLERSSPAYASALMEDLSYLGVIWQEGPNPPESKDVEKSPYWQSARLNIYQKYSYHLIRLKRAYPCFCSESDLALTRKLQRAQGHPPRYPGTCLHLSPEDLQEKLQMGLKPVLRFHFLKNESILFEDLVKGKQQYRTEEMGDFIIQRADGFPTFMFCNAIDDALMQVTHVIRGEDHLSNTPRQIAILKTLNLPIPAYAHIPLILGQDGAPLSKRNGSQSIQELRQSGYLPLAILNYLMRLGHHYESHHLMNEKELAQAFDLKNISQSPARFDSQHLNYWQKEALKGLTETQFLQHLSPEIHKWVEPSAFKKFIQLIRPNILFVEEALLWAKRLHIDTLLSDDLTQNGFLKEIQILLKIANPLLEKEDSFFHFIESLKKETGLRGKTLFQPLRIILTGLTHGPELLEMMDFMGKLAIKKRFEHARNSIAF